MKTCWFKFFPVCVYDLPSLQAQDRIIATWVSQGRREGKNQKAIYPVSVAVLELKKKARKISFLMST